MELFVTDVAEPSMEREGLVFFLHDHRLQWGLTGGQITSWQAKRKPEEMYRHADQIMQLTANSV
jgi:hypothetical protein